MGQIFSILTLLILLLVSCKKDTNTISVRELYTENSPVTGRSQLNFISNNIVVKSETGSNFKDTFSFSISTGKILLTPTWTTQYTGQQFDFEKIDKHTITIENLYPNIPGSPQSYMTYKK